MMKQGLGWALFLVAAVGGYYLSAILVLPFVRVFAAHTNPAAATAILFLRLALWAVFVWLGLLAGGRVMRK